MVLIINVRYGDEPGYKFLASLTSRSRSETRQNALLMSDPALQSLLDDDTEQAHQVPQRQNDTATSNKVNEVFTMFKTYLEEKIDEKGQQPECRGKTEKEVVQLNFKGKQKQYELNAKVDVILRPLILQTMATTISQQL